MKPRMLAISLLLLLLLAGLPPGSCPTATAGMSVPLVQASQQPAVSPGVRAHPADALSAAPLMFIENTGQFDPQVRFQAMGEKGTMFLTTDAIWFTVLEPAESSVSRGADTVSADGGLDSENEGGRGVNVKLSFVGANDHPEVIGVNGVDTRVSYLLGSDPAEWEADVPAWGGVRYKELYPGIDVELTSDNGHLVHRLITRPGADLNAVRLRTEGAEAVALEGDSLLLTTTSGELVLALLRVEGTMLHGRPSIANLGGGTSEINSPFTSSPPAYASSAQGTGDSDLVYGTFLGGTEWDEGRAIAVDASGAAYIAGHTLGLGFPTTPGAFDRTHSGEWDIFVAKLGPEGTGLAYSTFLGGHDIDLLPGIAVDPSGAAYVAGYTWSSDFPTTPGAFDRGQNGGADAFVTKLNPDGASMAWSTFLGGAGDEYVHSVAVGASGMAYIAGTTESSNFPTTSGAFDRTHNGGGFYGRDAFVTKLSAEGTSLSYSTFLGGAEDEDIGNALALGAGGEAYVTGYTRSSDFPVTPGAFDTTRAGDRDVFVTKLNASGSALVYSTFLGGSSTDEGESIAVDLSGAAYVTGDTASPSFPTTVGAFDTGHNGGWDVFVAKLNGEGAALVYGTFFGGNGIDYGNAIAVDDLGTAHIVGSTGSANFPTTSGALDTVLGGDGDAFVTKLNASGSALVYSTFLGGSSTDFGDSIALDASGAAYITGHTLCPDFPTTPGAFDISHNGYWDAFVTKLVMRHLGATHIEVTQAIQDQGNNVPLIEGKPTFVRVYVDCGAGCTSLANVTGVLRGYGPSGELQRSPLAPVNRFIVASLQAWTDQRSELEKTLNFTLPPEWTTGTITLTAEVSSGAFYDAFPQVITFEQARTKNIIYVPVRYNGQEPTSRIDGASWWARRVWPTAGINYIRWPTIEWSAPLGCLRYLGNAEKYSDCLSEDLKNRLTEEYRKGRVGGYIFGWLAEGVNIGVEGSSDPTWRDGGGAGRAAFGVDRPSEAPRTFAHEIGHLMGRHHTNTQDNVDYSGDCTLKDPSKCGGDRDCLAYVDTDSDWVVEDGLPGPPPYADSRIQDYGIDGYGFGWLVSSSSAVKNPAGSYDYMSYCGGLGEDNVWTSPWTYEHLYSEALQVGVTDLETRLLSGLEAYFISSGLVYTDDTATLDPIWVISSTVTPENPPAGTQYCLEAQDGSNIALVSQCFDLTFMNYETGEATDVDGFNLMLPYPSGVARIVLKKGASEVAVQSVSSNAPVVTVASPNGGETWAASDTYDITWSASDDDGDSLTYSVMYSTDASDWIPVGGTVTETQVTVNSGELAGSATARVRVLASDGVNTSEDQSDGVFTVGRKPPQVSILSPEGSIGVVPGTPILLQGYAYDLEDGVLEGASLEWSSDRDGALGTGSQVLVSLSPGQHVITFTAEDSDENGATATVDVHGGHETWLPVVLKKY